MKMDIISNEGDSGAWDANGYDWVMYIQKDQAGVNHLYYQYHTGALGSPQTLKVKASSVLTADTWHHIAITNDGSKVKLWIDGTNEDESTGIPSEEKLNGSFNLYIGGRYSVDPNSATGQGLLFEGYLDEVRISNAVRDIPAKDAFVADDSTLLLLNMEDLQGGFADLSNST